MDELKKQIEKFLDNTPKYIIDGRDVRARVLIEGRLIYPTDHEKTTILVAYRFNNGKILCPKCALTYDLVKEKSIAIYAIDVIPYSQNCHNCNCEIIIGWPCQLFSPL